MDDRGVGSLAALQFLSVVAMILVQCVFRGPAQGPARVVRAGSLSAAVTDVRRLDSSPEAIGEFMRVVAAFHRRRTVVPMRYGSCAEDDGELRRRIDEKRAEYEEILDRLDGCVEMGMRRLLRPASAPPFAKTGREYLALRKTALAERQGEVARLESKLAGLYSRSRHEFAAVTGLLSVYFLVPRAKVARFRAATRGSRFLSTGPWPPYNFVAEG